MSSQRIAFVQGRFGRVRIDLRDALRGLRDGRETTALAFVILTLTMAAGTVTFSVVDAVALRPLPYASPERLVGLSSPSPTPGRVLPASPQAYFDWLEGTHTFESLGATRFISPLPLEIDGAVETLTARSITANLFDVLGVRPAAGRFFGPEHERPGGPHGVILSHDLWVRRFRADPEVIDRRLVFGQDTREVVGVLPAGVWYPITLGPPPDLYVPYRS